MLQLIANRAALTQVPRLLGIYPVVSSNPQLREFANIWKRYGSITQLQVNQSNIHNGILQLQVVVIIVECSLPL